MVKNCPSGTRQFGLYCIKELSKPKVGMQLITLKKIHTVEMGEQEWIDLPRIDIPQRAVGRVTYVAGLGSPEFHVKWNVRKKKVETIEEDIMQTRDEIAQVIRKLRD